MDRAALGLGKCVLPQRAFSVARRHSRRLAAPRVAEPQTPETTTSKTNVEPIVETIAEGMDKIYIGKGKYIVDDPKKYPKKENAGDLLQGISGGWAGGEVGLKAFTADLPAELPKASNGASDGEKEGDVQTQYDGRDVVAKKMGEGDDTLYVGMGKFIVDDAKKYPSKESYGFGDLTGGFAGGEKGLKQFVEKGDIEFIDPNEQGYRQWSPIAVATLVAAGGSLGAIVLTNVFDLSQGLISQRNVWNNVMDDNTKLLIEVALGLLGVTWIGTTAFATFRALREKLSMGTQGATKVVISVGFWTLVLVAAYQIAQT